MNRTRAAMLFLGICIVLAVLLLAGILSVLAGGVLFAVALVVFGVLSSGFRRGRTA